MANELSNPGFEDAVSTYTGSAPLPASTGNWKAWRSTTTRSGTVVSQGAWAAKVDCPTGATVGTFMYQDLAATAATISYRLGFDIYIDNDGEHQDVAVLYGYDHDDSATGAPTFLEFTTASTSLSIGGVETLFDGLAADEWHTVLLETNVGATVQDLTIDGVFQGPATGPTGVNTDDVTILAGHIAGAAAATSLFYFDAFSFERTDASTGEAGSPLIAVEFASVKLRDII